MLSKKSSKAQIFRIQKKITAIRLKIQDLEMKKEGHQEQIKQINNKISELRNAIRALENK